MAGEDLVRRALVALRNKMASCDNNEAIGAATCLLQMTACYLGYNGHSMLDELIVQIIDDNHGHDFLENVSFAQGVLALAGVHEPVDVATIPRPTLQLVSDNPEAPD